MHLGINLHRFTGRHLRYAHVAANLVLLDNLLVEHGRGALLEGVALELGATLVGLDEAALEGGLVLCDDGDVDVASGAEIVKDTGLDGLAGELDGLVLGQGRLPLGLEDGHGGQGAGAHGDVGELVGGTVGVDSEEVGSRGVDAGDDEVSANVALVLEEVLLEHGHAGDDAGLAARGEGVELEVGGYDRRGELGVGGGTGSCTPNLRGDVVQLFAVLVGDDGARGCSCIGGNLKCTSLCQLLWQKERDAIGREERGGGGEPGESCRLPSLLKGVNRMGLLTTTPPSNMHPTMVVPVLVALGRGTPRAWRAALRL